MTDPFMKAVMDMLLDAELERQSEPVGKYCRAPDHEIRHEGMTITCVTCGKPRRTIVLHAPKRKESMN